MKKYTYFLTSEYADYLEEIYNNKVFKNDDEVYFSCKIKNSHLLKRDYFFEYVFKDLLDQFPKGTTISLCLTPETYQITSSRIMYHILLCYEHTKCVILWMEYIYGDKELKLCIDVNFVMNPNRITIGINEALNNKTVMKNFINYVNKSECGIDFKFYAKFENQIQTTKHSEIAL